MAHLDQKEFFGLERSWGASMADSLPMVKVFNKTAPKANKAALVNFDGEKY